MRGSRTARADTPPRRRAPLLPVLPLRLLRPRLRRLLRLWLMAARQRRLRPAVTLLATPLRPAQARLPTLMAMLGAAARRAEAPGAARAEPAEARAATAPMAVRLEAAQAARPAAPLVGQL